MVEPGCGRRRLGALVLSAALTVAAACDTGTPVLDEDDIVTPEVTDDAAAADLVVAYERSRTATYVVDQVWERSVEGEAVAPVPLRIVQRTPGDRLQIGGGSATGTVDGRVLRCSVAVGGEAGEAGGVDCVDGGPATQDDAAMVAAEVADLADLVEGNSPPYSVERGDEDGCFDLTLRLAIAAAPYGLAASFCFDETTGAVRLRTVDHGEGITDLFRATAIRGDVTDADLVVGSVGSLPTSPDPG